MDGKISKSVSAATNTFTDRSNERYVRAKNANVVIPASAAEGSQKLTCDWGFNLRAARDPHPYADERTGSRHHFHQGADDAGYRWPR